MSDLTLSTKDYVDKKQVSEGIVLVTKEYVDTYGRR